MQQCFQRKKRIKVKKLRNMSITFYQVVDPRNKTVCLSDPNNNNVNICGPQRNLNT